MDGTWVIHEADDEDAGGILEVTGGVATMWRPDAPDERLPVQIGDGQGGQKEIVLTSPSGERQRAVWAFSSPNVALILPQGSDELVFARRAGPVPQSLRGQWVLASPDDDQRATMTLGEDTVEWSFRGEAGAGRAWGLGGEGGAPLLLAVDMNNRGIMVLQATPVGADVYVMHANGDDDYRVAHREGRRPRWIPRPAAH